MDAGRIPQVPRSRLGAAPQYMASAERRMVTVPGTWQGKPLEFTAVEMVWKLQTGFRLRQELPDFW